MIDRATLLSDLQGLLGRLEDDLLQRSESTEVPQVGQRLREEYERAKKAQRTAQNYEDWRSDAITQAAAAWVLSCVFVRFLEDNRLIDPPKIAGPGKQLQQARDEHELYFRSHPKLTDRDYLLSVFDELASLPGTKDVFGEHNPIRELPNWLSGDAAGELLRFFQKIDANTGLLVHDFTDDGWDTRFLGDLYQDLSEAARKKYALLQTPEFVEEFILDRTLEPALNEFGLNDFRMIDPACGSGHFLLGSFPRILGRWQKKEPGTKIRDLIQRTLDSIHGVDVNPYAVAVARFRLLLMAMRAEEIKRLADAPAFHFNLVCGDSLLHSPLCGGQQVFDYELIYESAEFDHAYQSEDLSGLKRILRSCQYHAVVANPPYIMPTDRALNQMYRSRYATCHMKYSLSVPFTQRVFELSAQNGFTGQITANAFMRKESGRKLIEQFIPRINLTHVIDTSLAYVPGHGTPTVILFGRNQPPRANTVRAVSGIKRENCQPTKPAEGLVWRAICNQLEHPGSESEFISVADMPRERFCSHPWSIGGGGAAELKEQLDHSGVAKLGDVAESIGITCFTLEDEIFLLPRQAAARQGLPRCNLRVMIEGDAVRDWGRLHCDLAVFPYDEQLRPVPNEPQSRVLRYLWLARTCLSNSLMFGSKTKVATGLKWYEYGRLTTSKFRTPLSIIFAEVATHNHFVLDRGGKVFKKTAPIIKLPPGVSEDEHLAILGVLNSSVACFWMKQVLPDRGGGGIGGGIAAETWERFYEFRSNGLIEFPIVAEYRATNTPARQIDALCKSLADICPSATLRSGISSLANIKSRQRESNILHQRAVGLQEELDWLCYRLFGLVEEDMNYNKGLPLIELGQRAFEIAMARRIAAGELTTMWYARHGSTPITALPLEWPEDYRQLVERRIELIETDRNIGLIEQPEYKRRWNTEPWELQLERSLRTWLLDRLESYFDFDGRMNDDGKPTAKPDIALTSVALLADVARQDPDFMQVGEMYRDDPAFNIERLIAELVEAESVPLLPALRYKPGGLRKRAEWERTWELQREEDHTGNRLEIAVPPRYTSADFLKSDYWRLRGKLDVPKERWVSFPHCEGPDGTLVIAWAGYDHLQLARSISSYYVDIQERLGGRDDPRLVPLLACLLELVPWLKQWHNAVDPEFGVPMGDYFEGFINEEARQLGKTIPEIKAWQPPQRPSGRGRRKTTT